MAITGLGSKVDSGPSVFTRWREVLEGHAGTTTTRVMPLPKGVTTLLDLEQLLSSGGLRGDSGSSELLVLDLGGRALSHEATFEHQEFKVKRLALGECVVLCNGALEMPPITQV